MSRLVAVLLVMGLLFMSPFQNKCQATDEIIGQWLLEEGPDGTTFLDTSGYDNHGTLSGDVFWENTNVDPPSESWSICSTSADYEAIVPDNENILDITEDFTIEICANVGEESFLDIISKHYAYRDDDGSWNIGINREESGSDYLHVSMCAYGNFTNADSDVVLMSPGSWFYVAITYDDDSNEATFYINEDKTALYNTTVGMRTIDWQINDTTEPLTFGYSPNYNVGMGDGNKIASVTMYNYIVPEPATLLLLSLGGILLRRRRK
jgi:hypothetical protein